MGFYRGKVVDHYSIESSKKRTPGIEFLVAVQEQKTESGTWEPAKQQKQIRCNLWFAPGKDHSHAIKKLCYAGYDGGGLEKLSIIGKTVELSTHVEFWDGREIEKFELALPGGVLTKSAKSDAAFLAIDSILQSAKLPKVPDRVEQQTEKKSWEDDVPF